MVATRSKTRSSIGGDDHQPKIDDVLEEASTGRKRRASKGGKADGEDAGKKGGAKNKKRKTEEGNGEEVEGKNVAETSGAMDLGDGDEKDTGEGKEEQPIVVDSSRVDIAEPQVDENKDSNEEVKEVEEIKESESKESESKDDENKEDESKKAEASDNQEVTENQAEEPSMGATDKQDVKEAEKEIVQNDNVTEYGTIHFLYKPKVEVLHPGSVDDVQRLHIILQPHAQDDPSGKPVLSRMIHVGRKVLPATGHGRRQPFWAFVSAVAEDVGELHDALKESKNDTKTKGVRTTGADRLIASGPYCIVSQPTSPDSDRRTSFLCYATTLPREPGEVQKAFNIDAEGSFTISVKNAAHGDPPRAGLKEKANYPDELQSKMGSLRWHAIDPPTFLDYPNAELLLIASHGADIAQGGDIQYGEEIAHELEKIADAGDVADVEEEEKHEIEAGVQKGIFEMLKARGKHVVEGEDSLIKGTWV